MRMEHLLYLLLLHSVCHLLQWVGMTNLNYGKAKKLKSFIVQYDHLYPGVYADVD